MEAQIVPIAEARSLAQLDEAKLAIAAAREDRDADALKEWRDRAAAVQHYASKREAAHEAADDAGEIKLRAEAALGWIDFEANPEGHPFNDSPTEALPAPDVASATRAAWRKLGQVEQRGKLDELIAELRAESEKGITTARASRAAVAYLPKKRKRRKPVSETVLLREQRKAYTKLLSGIAKQAQSAEEGFEGVAYHEALLPIADEMHRQVREALKSLQAINDRMEEK